MDARASVNRRTMADSVFRGSRRRGRPLSWLRSKHSSRLLRRARRSTSSRYASINGSIHASVNGNVVSDHVTAEQIAREKGARERERDRWEMERAEWERERYGPAQAELEKQREACRWGHQPPKNRCIGPLLDQFVPPRRSWTDCINKLPITDDRFMDRPLRNPPT